MSITAFLEDIDVEHISARARQITVKQVLAGFLVGVARLLGLSIFAAGWLIAKAFSYLWFGAMWVIVAFAEGWNAGISDLSARRRE